MVYWYRRVTANPNNYLDSIPDVIEHFSNELEAARKEIKIAGSLEEQNRKLPGIVELRFAQLQEIEAILEFVNIMLNKLKTTKFRMYLEKYQRALTSRDADRYADGDEDVINLTLVVNEIALIRNAYLAIMKGIEQKSFAISNITKLRCSGLDDATLGN